MHLTTEDDRNIVSLHERAPEGTSRLYTAEWNDDFHHAAHVVATGENEGYYSDYRRDPSAIARALGERLRLSGRALALPRRAPRGVPSAHLPPTAFVNFLQNHDQIGNRAFSERLAELAEPEIVAA